MYLAFKEFQKNTCYSGNTGISTIALTESNLSSDTEDINTFSKCHRYMRTIQRSLYKNDTNLTMYPNAASTLKALDIDNEYSFYPNSQVGERERMHAQNDDTVIQKNGNQQAFNDLTGSDGIDRENRSCVTNQVDIKENTQSKKEKRRKLVESTELVVVNRIKNKRSKTELDHLRKVFPALLSRAGSSFHAYLKFIHTPESHLTPNTIFESQAEITCPKHIAAWFNTRLVYDSRTLIRYIGDFNIMLLECKLARISETSRAFIISSVIIKERTDIRIAASNITL